MLCYTGGDLSCSCKHLALALTLALILMALIASMLASAALYFKNGCTKLQQWRRAGFRAASVSVVKDSE